MTSFPWIPRELQGYIGDPRRMEVLGESDADLEDIFGVVLGVEEVARKAVPPGTPGGENYVAAVSAIRQTPYAPLAEFLSHGIGLTPNEAPRLTSHGPIPFDGYGRDRPLASGTVLSIETTIQHPKRGFIKLKETVVVTDGGGEGLGDVGRGWNPAGQ